MKNIDFISLLVTPIKLTQNLTGRYVHIVIDLCTSKLIGVKLILQMSALTINTKK